MSFEQGLPAEDFANNLLDPCATGKTDHLKQLMSRCLDKLEPTMPTPAYLVQTAAKTGHAEAIHIVFEALPKDPQCPSYPWDPPWLAGVPFSKVPEIWKTIEHSIVLAALEGNDALSVIKLFFEYDMEPD